MDLPLLFARCMRLVLWVPVAAMAAAQEFRPRTPFRKPHWLSQFAAVLSCSTHGKVLDERMPNGR